MEIASVSNGKLGQPSWLEPNRARSSPHDHYPQVLDWGVDSLKLVMMGLPEQLGELPARLHLVPYTSKTDNKYKSNLAL